MSLHVFCFFDSEWVVAADTDAAKSVYCEHTGEDIGELNERLADDEDVVRQLGDYETLKILCFQDGSIAPVDEDGCEPVEKTCVEWAAQNGRGFLATTEF